MVLWTERGGQKCRAIENDVLHLATEPLANDLRIPPLWRRRYARRWRGHVTADECEHASDKEFRRPGRECDRAAGLQDAKHFIHRDVRPRRKHVTVLTDDHVECGVFNWHLF